MIHADALKPPVAPISRPVLAAVWSETMMDGWPHAPTFPEMAGVLELVVRATHTERQGAVACPFPKLTMRRVKCGIVARGMRFAVRVTVWPNGTYALRGVR